GPAGDPTQHYRGPTHGRDEDLLQEADVLIREDRDPRDRRAKEHRKADDPGDEILEIFDALGESGNGRTADTETQQHEKQQGEDERTDEPRGRPEETLYITQPESINPERVDEIHSAASARSAERSPSGVRSRPDSSPRSRSP